MRVRAAESITHCVSTQHTQDREREEKKEENKEKERKRERIKK